VKANKLHSREV